MSTAPLHDHPTLGGDRRIGPWRSAGRARWWARGFGIALALLALLASLASTAAAASGPVDQVRTWSGWGVGAQAMASVPFGMVQPGLDGNGFGQTHMFGTGCPQFGDVPLSAVTAEPASGDPGSYRGPVDVRQATPDYLRADLARYGVTAELTATERTGWQRYTFPADAASGSVVIASGRNQGGPVTDARLRIVGDRTLEGSVTSGGFCGAGNRYTVHFAAEFSRPFRSTGTWGADGTPQPGAREASGPASGGWVTFDTARERSVVVKVGLSYVSIDGARRNLEKETSATGFDFDAVRRDAADAWARALGRIEIGGTSEHELQTFYQALWGTMLFPSVFSDADGRYRGFDDAVHRLPAGEQQYTNYSLWDTYRTQAPLLGLLFPERAGDMVQSLLRDAEQGGALPRWPVANDYTGTMVGDSAAPEIASMLAYGAKGVDVDKALRVLVEGATQPKQSSDGYLERPALEDYERLGYVPTGAPVWGPVSTSLEYSIDDAAIAHVADMAGDRQTAQRFRERGRRWTYLWNPANGLLQARHPDGSWVEGVTPTTTDNYVEGNAEQYTWMVPHDLPGLIERMGGREQAVRRLDAFFERIGCGSGDPCFYMNDFAFTTPWIYDYAGAPQRTQVVVRRIVNELFDTSRRADNDDMGADSAWYVWASLGLFPVEPGKPGLSLGSPLYPQATIHLGRTGRTVRIDAPAAAPDHPLIRALQVDGHRWRDPWLPTSITRVGGELAFDLHG